MKAHASDRVSFSVRERIGVSWPRTLCRFDLRARGVDPARVVEALVNGVPIPFQTAPARGVAGLFLSLPAGSAATVSFAVGDAPAAPSAAEAPPRAAPGRSPGFWLRFGGGAALLPPLGETRFDPPADSFAVPAPIRTLRVSGGRRVGRGWLDTRERVASVSCAVAETGPLWTTVRVRYGFESGAVFSFEATSADGEDFLRIREDAWLGPRARWVFALDADSGLLPDGVDLADHTLFHDARTPRYLCDRLVARLYPWSQASQIAALREGFVAHDAATGLAVGWFARTDPEWDGFKGAFVELRERRFDPSDPRSLGAGGEGTSFSSLPPDHPHPGDTASAPALCAEALLAGGTRSYGLFVGRRRDWHRPDPTPAHELEWYRGPARLAEWEAARSPLRARIQRQGLLSLDIVKDWDLSPSASARAPIPEFDPEAYPEDLRPLLGDLLANAKAIVRIVENDLDILAGGFVAARGPGGTNPVTLRPVFPYSALLRRMEETGALPRRTASRLFAKILFLAHLCARRSSYPGEFTMLPMRDPRSSEPDCLGMPNMNFLTDVYCVCGGVACSFPDHPASASWLARANRLLGLQLDVFSDPRSGSWEESHTYFNHVLRTLAPFALAQRGLPGGRDWFADRRFVRLARAALSFVTPRDPNARGLRMMATLGDHRMELRWHTGDLLARGFAAHRATRRLARGLAWLSQENGWGAAPSVPPLRPRLASLRVDGLGAALRNGSESLVLLRAGYQWGHHNNDELEVLFWASGEPVLCEAGYGNPKTFAKIGPSGHSILHPVGFEPAFYLSRANRGRITAFGPGHAGRPQVLAGERLVAFRMPPAGLLEPLPLDRPYRQTRRLEWMARAPDGASLLRVIDRWEGDEPQRLQFHTGGRSVERLGPGRLLVRGHSRDTLVRCSLPLEWEIVPDACGFTVGFGADLPPSTHSVTTAFRCLPPQ